MYIALKECVETEYWLELLFLSNYISKDDFESINSKCIEIKKILSAITKTSKESE